MGRRGSLNCSFFLGIDVRRGRKPEPAYYV